MGNGIREEREELEDGNYKVVRYNHYMRGEKMSECEYNKAGLRHGAYRAWYGAGTVVGAENRKKCEAGYENGRLSGAYRTWDIEGNPEVECFYTEGAIDGRYIVFSREIAYIKGRRENQSAKSIQKRVRILQSAKSEK